MTFWAVAAATGLVGAIILAAHPRREANRWLAFFLLLVSVNFTMQAVSVAGWLNHHREAPTVGWQSNALLDSIGYTALILDPIVLAMFASVFPRRTALAKRPWLLVPLSLLVSWFIVLEWTGRKLSAYTADEPYRLLFTAYLVACYFFAVRRLFLNFLGEPSTIMAHQLRIVSVSLMVAILSRIALVANDVQGYWELAVSESASAIVDLALRLAILGSLYFYFFHRLVFRASDSARRGEAVTARKVVGVFLLIFSALWVVDRTVLALWGYGGIANTMLRYIMWYVWNAVVFPIRWFVFCGGMLYGIARYQVLATNPRRVASVGLAAAALAGFFGVGLTANSAGPWFAAWVAGAFFLCAGWGVYVGITRDVSAGAAGDWLRRRGLEAYQALVAASLAEGPLTNAREQELGAARRRLRISPQEHEDVLAIATAEEAGAAGRRVLEGRYEVLQRLGSGAFARVHLARDRKLDRLVVVKEIQEEWAGPRSTWDGALRELEVARRVSHPNLISIHEVARSGDAALIVMDHAARGSLRDLMEREPGLSRDRAVWLVGQILDGLEALHSAGIIHADLKPENVLIAADGHVKLADFGAARGVPRHQTLVRSTESPAALGTLLYMAPERVRGDPPSVLGDVFAVGAIASELLTGHLVRGEEPRPGKRAAPASSTSDAADPLRRWLARALADEPQRRFRTAREMAVALGRIVQSDRASVGTERPS